MVGAPSTHIDDINVSAIGNDATWRPYIQQTLATAKPVISEPFRTNAGDGNFVIADQSSNGTFLLIDGNSREMLLRREEAVMGERGWVGFGKSAEGHGTHVLRYRLERRGT